MSGRTQREFFDSRADQWERNCYPKETRVRLRELIPEFGLKPAARVLDVGTGPGVLIPSIREAIGPQGRICAFDLSFAMISQARLKPLLPSDLTLQADAQRLPFASNIFDNVVCFAAFPHFDDPQLALSEMARVARPGGTVVIAHLLSREELTRHHGGHEVVADDILPDAETMRSFFRRAGLDDPFIQDRPGRYLARARKKEMEMESSVKAGFDQWAVFEKMRAANRMRHREAYETMERVIAGFERPPRILDIGCGDGREIAAILKRVPAALYVGIDNSSDNLEQARANFSELSVPGRLILGDYTEAFTLNEVSFDLILLGLFLHHFPTGEKREFFRQASRLLAPDGVILAHDLVLREDEDRQGFLDRLALACESWPELSAEERKILTPHWSGHGHQERLSALREFAGQAGFFQTEVLWRDPEDFYVVVAFRR